jgi:3'-phosphoadenosine 5'-phosphosulfate sulfotransferase (PAPS reductase)/FAD synthetase
LRIVDQSIDEHVVGQGKLLAAICVLFSGGNDSTVLAHMFRSTATHAIHANTTIGIETTREFVRNTCEEWGLPLIEKTPPRVQDHYRAQVLLHGFPGPGRHAVMFQRLKERGLRAARKDIIGNRGHRERVLYIAGRRRAESARRASIPANGRDGAIVWSSPLLNWTKPDLMTYRLMHGDVPVNEVSQIIHMSGECLCGAFASPGEREELEFWFDEHLDLIRWLEAELLKPAYDHIPAYRKTWGWGAIPDLLAQAPSRERKPKSAGLCDSCNPAIAGLFDVREAS